MNQHQVTRQAVGEVVSQVRRDLVENLNIDRSTQRTNDIKLLEKLNAQAEKTAAEIESLRGMIEQTVAVLDRLALEQRRTAAKVRELTRA